MLSLDRVTLSLEEQILLVPDQVANENHDYASLNLFIVLVAVFLK